jgi:hypothetical protein
VTADQRTAVRVLVERTCAEQGIPLTVPAEVARTVAAMVAVGRPRPAALRRELTGDARSAAE